MFSDFDVYVDVGVDVDLDVDVERYLHVGSDGVIDSLLTFSLILMLMFMLVVL